MNGDPMANALEREDPVSRFVHRVRLRHVLIALGCHGDDGAWSLFDGSVESGFSLSFLDQILSLVAVVIVAWGSATELRAQDCMKWNNELSDCQPGDGQLADPSWCNGTTLLPLSPAQEVELLSRRYADTPEEVLQEWAQYGYPAFNADPMLVRRFSFVMGTEQNEIRVWFEAAPGDGMYESGETPTTTLKFGMIPRESCCEANVEGPHTDLIDQIGDTWFEQPGGDLTEVFERAPVRGGSFTSRELDDGVVKYAPQIVRIRNRNAIPPLENADYLSDLLRPEAKSLRKFEFFGGQLSNLEWYRSYRGPQVDHIIPRVDKNGCPCGSNSFKNAQVISAKLNRQLSNSCSDPRRRAMIDFYTKPLSPPATAPAATSTNMFVVLEQAVTTYLQALRQLLWQTRLGRR